MALSNEAIIAIITLAVMCLPAVIYACRYFRRRIQEGPLTLFIASLVNVCGGKSVWLTLAASGIRKQGVLPSLLSRLSTASLAYSPS
jgi:hypothetical protein